MCIKIQPYFSGDLWDVITRGNVLYKYFVRTFYSKMGTKKLLKNCLYVCMSPCLDKTCSLYWTRIVSIHFAIFPLMCANVSWLLQEIFSWASWYQHVSIPSNIVQKLKVFCIQEFQLILIHMVLVLLIYQAFNSQSWFEKKWLCIWYKDEKQCYMLRLIDICMSILYFLLN